MNTSKAKISFACEKKILCPILGWQQHWGKRGGFDSKKIMIKMTMMMMMMMMTMIVMILVGLVEVVVMKIVSFSKNGKKMRSRGYPFLVHCFH